MNNSVGLWREIGIIGISILCLSQFSIIAEAASTDIANVPMAVKNAVTPNVLVVYDNSESMDAYMSGSLVAGSDPSTRGNIGRQVMRNSITSYRTAFNWGLMTYGMSSTPGLYNTWVYYMGSDTGMVFTDDCVGYVAGVPAGYPPIPGVSASNGGRSCVANPQPFTGGNYVTYDLSSDNPNILDVLYDTGTYTVAWGLSSGTGSGYKFYGSHSSVNSWTTASFSGDPFGCGNCTLTFTPTDAGFLPANPPITRQLYMRRAWGYLSAITGYGNLNEAVQADSTTHYNNLQALLASETNSSTSEVKNGAVFTPLKGTLDSAKTYFSTSYQGHASPIQYSCQQNFVMMVTDGLPTGKTDGTLYSAADRANTCAWSATSNSCTTGSFGTAAQDAINSVTALRTTTATPSNTSVPQNYDIQTYVVALGDTVANASALSVMNAMASYGGTGSAYLASNATSFQNAISAITDSITAKIGAAAAVAVANAHVTSTDNTSYASSYNSGTWTGDLNAYSINVDTGVPLTTSLWSAQDQLDLLTSATRKIVTSTDTAGAIGGIQFQPTSATTATKLSSAQQTLLNSPTASPVDGAAVLAYLRGDRSGEGTGLPYRVRAHLMGDVVNAEPVMVREPSANYGDAGYMGSTTTFKESNASRARTIYQGANDGMLHAISATSGTETWAYIPNLLMANLNNLSEKASFTHKYYVDGTPVSGDVDFKNCCLTGGGNEWHTILVGGLGKGGNGYYALDVTNPDAADEAAVASKVLWEFPNSVKNSAQRITAKQNTGYTFGKPIIVKTAAKGWVVLVTSGYNNGTNAGDSGGDGLGHLFVLNPMTGDLIKDIPTTGCATTPSSTPCGLAQISAYVENTDVDNTTDYVYGGDLMGNVWRFDFTGNSVSSWGVSRFAVLKDESGATQPVTSAPELAKIMSGGIAYRFIYVGTGQYLGDTDVPCPLGGCTDGKTENSHATQTQTMYGLVDTLTASLPDPLRNNLQVQTVTTSGDGLTRTISSNAVDLTVKKGWYVDLPTTGERVNTDPALALGALVFTSNIPNSTVCIPGGSSWLYFLNYQTGGLVAGSTTTWSGMSLGNVLASRPVLIQLPSGQVVVLVRKSDATTQSQQVPLPPSTTSGRRVSWREIIQQ
ncbi:MAG: PilC/PilY family type IV pilus protein [Thiothrix sp.]|uniref:pilus assembly protein n=1 Tax=Thiothrix sp. TaxID=1032 RepID=UPI00262477DD|nr:PilC/PilY family type IV pilus protein [Thiothrix sp.]MDD5395528.1 PilC/PilY family type IV pilus protein [Thiothrix sp.]